jgi:hypothetical protein
MSTGIQKQESFEIQHDQIKYSVVEDKLLIAGNEMKLFVPSLPEFSFDIQAAISDALELSAESFTLNRLSDIVGQVLDAEIVCDGRRVTALQMVLSKAPAGDEKTFVMKVHRGDVPLPTLQALINSRKAVGDIRNQIQNRSLISAEARNLIFEIQELFQAIKAKSDLLEQQAPKENLHDSKMYEIAVVEDMLNYLMTEMDPLCARIPVVVSKMNEQAVIEFEALMRKNVTSLVYGAPFVRRALDKPLGYAGDFEMMTQVYKNEPMGATYFDKCVHLYCIRAPSGYAVRNRREYLIRKMRAICQRTPVDKPIKVFALASGPASEISKFIETAPEFHGRPIEFTCIDQDLESLKYAQRQVRSTERTFNSGYSFKFIHQAIRNLIKNGCPENDYDLIYSAGMFDYLTDMSAKISGKKLSEYLKPGGQLVIGNFSDTTPIAPFMDYVVDWKLIYRNPETLLKLYGDLGTNTVIESEPEGINLFAVITK